MTADAMSHGRHAATRHGGASQGHVDALLALAVSPVVLLLLAVVVAGALAGCSVSIESRPATTPTPTVGPAVDCRGALCWPTGPTEETRR